MVLLRHLKSPNLSSGSVSVDRASDRRRNLTTVLTMKLRHRLLDVLELRAMLALSSAVSSSSKLSGMRDRARCERDRLTRRDADGLFRLISLPEARHREVIHLGRAATILDTSNRCCTGLAPPPLIWAHLPW